MMRIIKPLKMMNDGGGNEACANESLKHQAAIDRWETST